MSFTSANMRAAECSTSALRLIVGIVVPRGGLHGIHRGWHQGQ
jgi:hypothetical protein